MLNRRILRVKVMQALYAFYQSDERNPDAGLQRLFSGIDKLYELYLFLLWQLCETADFETSNNEEKQQHLQILIHPHASENTSRKLLSNQLLADLNSNAWFRKTLFDHKVHLLGDPEVTHRLFLSVRNSEVYQNWQSAENTSYEDDKKLIIAVFGIIINQSSFESYVEEKNIYWADEQEFLYGVVQKTLESFSPKAKDPLLRSAFRDEEDDRVFAKEVFLKTLAHNGEYEAMIREKVENWELERITLTDVILIKMALTEVMYIPSVPVKVSINEYIDISKDYSSPKSKAFINGIIDKIVQELKAEGKFLKTGRGLLEQ